MPLDSPPHRRHLVVLPDPDALPASPPPAVLARMADAARALERLTAVGIAPRFALDDAGGLTITLHDADGRAQRRISPSQALDLAAGAFPLPA